LIVIIIQCVLVPYTVSGEKLIPRHRAVKMLNLSESELNSYNQFPINFWSDCQISLKTIISYQSY